MNIQVGDKALITLDNWFYAPDGRQYKAVHGTVKAVLGSEETLGIRTNARSTNWYVEIGDMTIAGCQIHYLVKTDACSFDPAMDYATGESGLREYMRPSNIYNAD